MIVSSWIDGQIGHVEITRPEQRNALDTETLKELTLAFEKLASNRDVRCLILTGAGRSFSAGGDLEAVRRQTVDQTIAQNCALLKAVDVLERLPTPSIAALQGHALGGGFELALGATVRIASKSAKVGFPEVRIGLIPGGGGTSRLMNLVPKAAALRLLVTGEIIDADEALKIGLISDVVADDELANAAAQLAGEIASNGPLAIRAVREIFRLQCDGATAGAQAETDRRLPEILASVDLREGLAAFAQRRPPEFTGR